MKKFISILLLLMTTFVAAWASPPKKNLLIAPTFDVGWIMQNNNTIEQAPVAIIVDQNSVSLPAESITIFRQSYPIISTVPEVALNLKYPLTVINDYFVKYDISDNEFAVNVTNINQFYGGDKQNGDIIANLTKLT